MSTALVTALVGCLAYAVSTAYPIGLYGGLSVPIAAALAAPTAAAAFRADAPWVAVVGAGSCLVVALAGKRSVVEALVNGAMFIGLVLTAGFTLSGHQASYAGVVSCMGLTGLYLLVDCSRQLNGDVRHVLEDRSRMWWLLQAVLISAGGLTFLVEERLGWLAFVAMAGVLALAKREFEAFAASRKALEQTMDVLDSLERHQKV